MSSEREPDHEDPEDMTLPGRSMPDGSEAARERLLARVMPGGLAPFEDSDGGPTVLGDRYEIVRRLGQGGMGEVLEAIDRETGERRAIKRLRPMAAAHEPTRRRFLREARTAAAVVHSGIVEIFDVGTTDLGMPFIVMELLEGRSLEGLLRREGALPWDRARRVLLEVADALHFAHERGVIHRDLKPANVMLAGTGEGTSWKLIDFGLAKRELIMSGSDALSRTGEVFGSPPFMSPEQFRGETADVRSDVYSFGCLMYNVLTGQRPFPGQGVGDYMYMHLFEPARPPRKMDCPEPLVEAVQAIVLRCMRKYPDDRFGSMADVAAAIRRLDKDTRPVKVPEDRGLPGLPRSRRKGRRIPWPLLGAATLAGVAAGVWVWRTDVVAERARPTPKPAVVEEAGPVPGQAPAADPMAPAAAPVPVAPADPTPDPEIERSTPSDPGVEPEVEPDPPSRPPRARRGGKGGSRRPDSSDTPAPEPEPGGLPPNPFRSDPP